MIPAISQVCCLNASVDQEINDFAAAQCHVLEGWLTKIENYLERHSIESLRETLARNQMRFGAAALQGGLLASQGAAREEAWCLLDRRLGLCRQLNIPVLVVACDVPGPLGRADLERCRMSLGQLARKGEETGVRMAVEFQARSALGNNLQTLSALVEEVGSLHLGICLDVFHFFVGPSKLSDLAYLTSQSLLHVQLCDLADKARELATDGDRILPGDGDFWLAPIIDRLREIDYPGCVSLEVMNPHLAQIPPLQMGEIGMTALRKLLGQAAMR